MIKKEVYALSGLGADERVFQNLNLSFKIIYIRWISPKRNEIIEDYAKRLLSQIKTVDPTIIGVSFGGIIAIEIAKQISCNLILISSVKKRSEIPVYFRLAGKLNLPHLIPGGLLKHANFITNWFFGTNSQSDKRLLKVILKETDSNFLKWAMTKIANWQNTIVPDKILHIHGSRDRLLPARNADIIIKNGGHLMILNRSKELSNILNKHVSQIIIYTN